MKNISKIISVAAFILLISVNAGVAQTAAAEVKIKTSAICEMCKERIEKGVSKEKGVIKSDVDVDTKYITVKYDPSKTNPAKIREAIATTGYDADSVAAKPAAYKKLPHCCQKGGK